MLELLDPNDEKKGVRLVETRRMLRGTYACLSYCWGDPNAQIGRTIHGTLSRYLQGIPFDELPDTVIDVIRLCFKLGFRYLWVDRLCIVQDDPKDWSEEAARMCQVYSLSALTIAVPLCTESSESFVAERRKGFREQSQFTTVTHIEEKSKFKSSSWVCKTMAIRRFGPWFLEQTWGRFAGDKNNDDNRWLSRAWTFQEWMLSPRVLHIDSMTMWECFDGYANELNRRCMGEARLRRNPREWNQPEGISWEFLVEEYSRRQITYESDRLPALAGLATSYAEVTGHTYLAGLWREEMPRTLLWTPRPEARARGPGGGRHGPSWSWASSTDAVQFGVEADIWISRSSISSVLCQYDPPGSLTVVKKAWVDVDGRVAVVTAQKEVEDDDPRWKVRAGDEWWDALPDHGEGYPKDAIARENVYLLRLGSTPAEVDGVVEYPNYALVLQECGWEDDRQCFQRLGIAEIFCDEEMECGPPWEARVVRLV